MRIRGYVHFETAIAMGLQLEIFFRCLGQSNKAFYFKHRSTNLSTWKQERRNLLENRER